MWILKLKLMHKDCHIVPRCKKYHVITYALPLSGIYKEKNYTYLSAIHFLKGEEKNKKLFLRDLKKDKRIINLEIKGDRFSYVFKLPNGGEHVQLYYHPKLIFIKPVINHYDGFEYWELGSWKRDDLTNFMKLLKKHVNYFKLLKLSRSKLVDVYLPLIFPSLTDKQKKAIDLAYRRGYYSYPRKINLKQLAKEFGISVPSFQEHLRKAEIKLLPFIIEQNM